MKEQNEGATLPDTVRKQMEERAESLLSRNEDTLFDVDDVVSRYAERYFRKLRYFDAARGSEEQFVGMICSCVDAELIPELIEDRERRQGMKWLDAAIDAHGKAVSGDGMLTGAAEAALLQRILIQDVRDTLRALPPHDRRIGALFLKHGNKHGVELALGLAHSTFEKLHWPRFVKKFAEIWKEGDNFRSEVR